MAGRILTGAFTALGLMIAVALGLGVATSPVGDEPILVLSLEQLRSDQVISLDGGQLFAVYNDGDVLALSSDAEHLGDEVEYCESSGLFESPAHGEKFDSRGVYFGGPARRGLARYPVTIEDDAVTIDLLHPVAGPRRGAEKSLEPRGPFCLG